MVTSGRNGREEKSSVLIRLTYWHSGKKVYCSCLKSSCTARAPARECPLFLRLSSSFPWHHRLSQNQHPWCHGVLQPLRTKSGTLGQGMRLAWYESCQPGAVQLRAGRGATPRVKGWGGSVPSQWKLWTLPQERHTLAKQKDWDRHTEVEG